MQRYNTFFMIHKGLRQMLYQTASHILQTDFCEAEAAAQILPQVAAVLDLFDGHANTEDNFVLPAIEAFEPSVVNLFEEEHVQDHALSNRMRALINMFHHAVSSEEKREMGSAIRMAFTEFLVFNLQHMAKEELLLNNLLWKYYTDEQLHAITQKIIAHTPQEKARQYNEWMMRSLSNNEIVGWLKNIKQEAPDVVFESMLGLAEKELSTGRWSAVLEEITAAALPA